MPEQHVNNVECIVSNWRGNSMNGVWWYKTYRVVCSKQLGPTNEHRSSEIIFRLFGIRIEL